MRYVELKNQVLKLLNQYSIAGDEIADTYNNQDDYLKRIPALANDCIMELATTARKIPATICTADMEKEEIGAQVIYTLPADFFQFKSGDTLRISDNITLHTNVYMIHGQYKLIIPKCEDGKYVLTYYRYPHLLPEEPDDNDEIDNVPETHYAIPYYVCSFLAVHDDSFQYAAFRNTYADKVDRMMPDITAEVKPVDDAYGLYGMWMG